MTPYHRSKCLMDNSHLLLISVLSGPEIGSDTCRMKVFISEKSRTHSTFDIAKLWSVLPRLRLKR